MRYIENEKGTKHLPHKTKWIESDSMEAFEEGCSVLIQPDEIVIDIDLPSESHPDHKNVGLTTDILRKMIRYFNIETEYYITHSGGMHLVFQRPPELFKTGTEGICALGIEVEYKPASKIAHCVKANGKAYEAHNVGKRQPLPEIFRKASQRKWFPVIMSGTKEGERDNKMFKHAISMVKFKSRAKILTFINEYFFETPLTKDRMDHMIDLKGSDNDLPFPIVAGNEMGDILKPVHYLEQLYFRHPQLGYVKDSKNSKFDYRLEIDKHYPNQLRKVMSEIEYQFERKTERLGADTEFHLNLGNGMLIDGLFIEDPTNTPDFSPFNIRHKYNKNAKPVKAVDDYLDFITWDDKDTRKTILQMIASGLITQFKVKGGLKKFFIIKGIANSGKGTLVEVIKHILGADNIASVKPNQLDDDKKKDSLVGKLINLGDDLKKGLQLNLECTEVLKNMISCDMININRMYVGGVEVRLVATPIYTTNHSIKTIEKDPDFEDKKIIIPMMRRPEKRDPELLKKLTTPEAIEYWMKLIVEEYVELYASGEYFISEAVRKATEGEAESNVNVLSFLKDFADEFNRDSLMGYPVKYVFEFYKAWCISENGGEMPKDLSLNTFTDVVCKKLDIGTTRIKLEQTYSTCNHFVSLKDVGVSKASELSREYPKISKGAEPVLLEDHLPDVINSDGTLLREPNKEEQANSVKHMSMYDHAMDARRG